MAILSGNSHRVWLDTVLVPNVTSTSLSVSNALLEATLSDSGSFDEFISGIKSSDITVDVLGFPSASLNIGDKVRVRIGTEELSHSSDAIIQDISVNGSSDTAVGHSISIKVIGVLAEFIPIFRLDKLVTDTGDQVITDTGDNICVSVQSN